MGSSPDTHVLHAEHYGRKPANPSPALCIQVTNCGERTPAMGGKTTFESTKTRIEWELKQSFQLDTERINRKNCES